MIDEQYSESADCEIVRISTMKNDKAGQRRSQAHGNSQFDRSISPGQPTLMRLEASLIVDR